MIINTIRIMSVNRKISATCKFYHLRKERHQAVVQSESTLAILQCIIVTRKFTGSVVDKFFSEFRNYQFHG